MAAIRGNPRMLQATQWRALRSQKRLDVVMAMEAHAPCSIAELSKAMGCQPAGLYRHMRTLVRAGLLVESGRKTAGKRWATVYDLGPYLTAMQCHAPSGRGLREHGELVLSLARPAGRAYLRGVLSQRGRSQAALKRSCHAMFERTWLDARAQAQVHRLVHTLYAVVQRGRRLRRGERFQISLMSAPTAG